MAARIKEECAGAIMPHAIFGMLAKSVWKDEGMVNSLSSILNTISLQVK